MGVEARGQHLQIRTKRGEKIQAKQQKNWAKRSKIFFFKYGTEKAKNCPTCRL